MDSLTDDWARAVRQTLNQLGAGSLEPGPDGCAFVAAGIDGFAYPKPGGNRLRGSLILALIERPDEAQEWVAAQPRPAGGHLEVVGLDDETWCLRILFERLLSNVEPEDPLIGETLEYRQAWTDRRTASPASAMTWKGDPRDLPPQNAWLMLGDEASYPSRSQLTSDAARGRVGVFETRWTAAKQTVVGDLLIFYFTSPRKAVCFVARAASRAFYDSSVGVNAHQHVRDEQWWCYTTPLIEIDPIPYPVLAAAADGHLPLRGRSGHYLRPEVIEKLALRPRNPVAATTFAHLAVPPVGNPSLPVPAAMSFEQWRDLPSGALALEKNVEQFVVEPLLRLALADVEDIHWERQYRVGPKFADYVVVSQGKPVCVLEAKSAIRETVDGVWSDSKDFQQARQYADSLGCGSILIDANRIVLIDRAAEAPRASIERAGASVADLKEIGRHIDAFNR